MLLLLTVQHSKSSYFQCSPSEQHSSHINKIFFVLLRHKSRTTSTLLCTQCEYSSPRRPAWVEQNVWALRTRCLLPAPSPRPPFSPSPPKSDKEITIHAPELVPTSLHCTSTSNYLRPNACPHCFAMADLWVNLVSPQASSLLASYLQGRFGYHLGNCAPIRVIRPSLGSPRRRECSPHKNCAIGGASPLPFLYIQMLRRKLPETWINRAGMAKRQGGPHSH